VEAAAGDGSCKSTLIGYSTSIKYTPAELKKPKCLPLVAGGVSYFLFWRVIADQKLTKSYDKRKILKTV
jgi:hypothetical protein